MTALEEETSDGCGQCAACQRGMPHCCRLKALRDQDAFESEVQKRVNEQIIKREVERRISAELSMRSGVRRLDAVDLTEVLKPDYEYSKPTILCLDDGSVCLFEQGRTHSINGDTGSGKTWLTLLGVAQQLEEGETVVYIDCEDNEEGIVGRLLAIGVDREAIRTQFSYRRPFGAWTDEDVDGLVAFIVEHEVPFVVLDGATDALAMHGLGSNLDTDVALLFSVFGGRLAAAGAAVVFIDHVTNEAAASGGAVKARGSGHKVGGLSGTAVFVDGDQEMGRGVVGWSHISIGRKVRGGWLQQHTVDGPVKGKRRLAKLEVDATADNGTVTVALDPPVGVRKVDKEGDALLDGMYKANALRSAITDLWDDDKRDVPMSKNAIKEGLKGRRLASATEINGTVDLLEADGYLEAVKGGWVLVKKWPVSALG